MNDIISKVIPILLLIAFGYVLQYKRMVTESTMNEIKKGVMSIALPAVLFLTFKDMAFEIQYLWVMIIVFLLLIVFYFVGLGLNKIKRIAHPILPFIVTGFTFGLLGIPLYGSVFGVENLGKISVFGVGHEFFIWFVLMTLLKNKFNDTHFSMAVAKDFLKSPLIIAILAGLTLNFSGLSGGFNAHPILAGVNLTLQYIGDLATPLILIIVGFGLKVNKKYMKKSVELLALRITVIMSIGYLAKFLLIDRIMGADPLFDYAYFTLLILPPPFAIPIFIGEYSTEENRNLANNTVVLSTFVSIVAYVIFVVMI